MATGIIERLLNSDEPSVRFKILVNVVGEKPEWAEIRKFQKEISSSPRVKLHYPCYWRYDILFGLKVMAEAGFIGDGRCNDALDLLESKRLVDGGFPAEAKYYQVTKKAPTGCSLVDWGGVSMKRMNS